MKRVPTGVRMDAEIYSRVKLAARESRRSVAAWVEMACAERLGTATKEADKWVEVRWRPATVMADGGGRQVAGALVTLLEGRGDEVERSVDVEIIPPEGPSLDAWAAELAFYDPPCSHREWVDILASIARDAADGNSGMTVLGAPVASLGGSSCDRRGRDDVHL